MINNATKSQLKQKIDISKQKFNKKFNRNYLSSDSESECETNKKAKKDSSILDKSKTIKKSAKEANIMHGATVVPEAAHLKFRRLLDKKK